MKLNPRPTARRTRPGSYILTAALAAAALAGATAVDAGERYRFSDGERRSLPVEVVEVFEHVFTVVDAKGTTYTLLIADLDKKDREYLENLGKPIADEGDESDRAAPVEPVELTEEQLVGRVVRTTARRRSDTVTSAKKRERGNREWEAWYDLRLQNVRDFSLRGVRVEFTMVESSVRMNSFPEAIYRHGESVIAEISPGQTYEMETHRLAGREVTRYEEDPDTKEEVLVERTRLSLRGVRVRVYVGDQLIDEVLEPSNLKIDDAGDLEGRDPNLDERDFRRGGRFPGGGRSPRRGGDR